MDRELASEIAVARVSAGRGLRAVGLFSVWLMVTWLGPALSPSAGWGLWPSAAALAGYSLLTVGALVAVWLGACRLVRTGVLRRVVSAHLAPFWMVALAATFEGGAVWASVEDPVTSLWLGLGCALNALSGAYALARMLEVRELRHSRRQIAHAPSEVALRTWRRELSDRLDAAGSIRFG